jgi:hypothetical protein
MDTVTSDSAGTLGFSVVYEGDQPSEDQLITALLRRLADVIEPRRWDTSDRIGEIREAAWSDVFDTEDDVELDPTPNPAYDRQALADGLRKLVADAILASMPPLHAHYGLEARDCDGRHSFGIDIAINPNESEFDFENRMFAMMRDIPDVGPIVVNITEDDKGRIMYSSTRQTEEGYSNSGLTICDQDDYELGATHRDHTAERAGY